MIAAVARSRRSELPAAAAVARLLAAAVTTVLAAVLLAACAGPPPSHRAPASGVGFRISQRDSLYDVPLDIRVTGLRPGERVTVGLSATNEVGSRWSAQATFVASGQILDLAAAAPVAGSYRGVAGMGLFESMRNRRFVSYVGGAPVVNSAAETGAWRDALAFLGRLS
jgi:Acyl-CoA thioester hydrolase/BAAT N-terminal region